MKNFLHKRGIYPRRWLLGLVSYSRFIGYIKPKLCSNKTEGYQIWRKLLLSSWQPRQLKVPIGKRLLAISPHSDDEAIGAGGVLWAHRDVSEIHILVVTDGAQYGAVPGCGYDIETEKKRRVELRREELMQTARMLHTRSVTFLNMKDRGILVGEEEATQLKDVLDKVRPDVILLPWFLDGHVDHRNVNKLLAMASRGRSALVLAYEIWSMLEPNAYFDISTHINDKVGMVSNYASQVKQVNYTKFVRGLAAVRGYQFISGQNESSAAEAFIALPLEDYCDLANEVL